jgi:5-methylcytosine-specific restriction endonuclease McrA
MKREQKCINCSEPMQCLTPPGGKKLFYRFDQCRMSATKDRVGAKWFKPLTRKRGVGNRTAKFLRDIRAERGYQYQNCQGKFAPVELDGHHIRKRTAIPRGSPEWFNASKIVVLCRPCHELLEDLPIEEALRRTGQSKIQALRKLEAAVTAHDVKERAR